MGSRGQPDDAEPGSGVSEPGHRAPPVDLVRRTTHVRTSRDLLTPCDEPGAPPAGDDLGGQLPERSTSPNGSATITAYDAGRASPRQPPSAVALLVRHGTTPTTGKVLPGQGPGLHLSDVGRKQAQATAERIAGLKRPPVAIYSSPLERAQETAQPLAGASRPARAGRPGLPECDFGDWTGAELKNLRKLREWRRRSIAPEHLPVPEGESFKAMQHRITATLDRLADRSPRPDLRLLLAR